MSVRAIEAEVSIKSGVQAECSIGREVIVEVHDDVNLESLSVTANGSYRPESGVDGWDRVTVEVPERQPVTEPLSVTANGQYEPSEGVDGFSGVTVSVPERVPVTESLSVTQNGTYEPTEGIDGYDSVTVEVPPTIPDIEALTVTENGTYTAEGDGYNPVVVSVPPTVPDIEPLTVTENGIFTASGDGYNPVTVNVPERIPVTESLTATSNGTYEPDSGVDGYDHVTVAVPERQPDIETLTATANGIYTSSKDGYNPVVVAVPERIPTTESISVTQNGTYTPPSGVDGFNSVTVDVESSSDPHAYDGEFEGTETGVLTIDTGYTGDGFAKLIDIYPVDGLLDINVMPDVPNRALNFLDICKTDYRKPLYYATDSGSQNGVRLTGLYKNGTAFSGTSTTGFMYTKVDNNGMYGIQHCVKMPDNHTLKIFVSSTADPTTPSNNFLPTGIKFKWRAIY